MNFAKKIAYRIGQICKLVLFGNQKTRAHYVSQLRAKFFTFTSRGIPFAQKPHADALNLLTNPSEKFKIAVYHSGTLGDKINLSRFISAVKEKYPNSLIFVFDIHKKFNVVFERNPKVSAVFQIYDYGLPKTIDWLIKHDFVDVFFENRYVVKSFFGNKSKIDIEEQSRYQSAFKPFESLFNQMHDRPDLLLKHSRSHSISEWDFMELSSLMPVTGSRALIPVNEEDENIVPEGRYVTIHHGAAIPEYLQGTYKTQTKNWSINGWEQVVRVLKSHGVTVYQIGVRGEEAIPLADQKFMGGLTFHQTAALIKNARLHLDTEGGMVHLARAFDTPSLVIFGPTPVSFFGYKENFNISTQACEPCCWTNSDWMYKCPKGYENPICMSSIEPQTIISEIQKQLQL